MSQKAKNTKKKPGAKKGGARPSSSQDNSQGSNLMQLLKDGGSLQEEVERVVGVAAEDPCEATAGLLNFLILSCGSSLGNVEGWQVQADDVKTILVEVSDRVPSTAVEKYPLLSKEKKWEKFKYNFANFWKLLVRSMERTGALYDSDSFEILMRWVSGLSCSKVRSFRHHAMVAAYNMISALAKLGATLVDLSGKLAAKEKGKGKKTRTAAEEEVDEKLDRVESLLRLSFEATCFPRHRDILPDLRAISLQFQADWSIAFPKLFVADEYTKHIGWGLYDSHTEVRLHAIRALEEIYRLPSTYAAMKAFTLRFKSRIQEMPLDASTPVAVHALSLVSVLLELEARHKDEIFAENVQDGLLDFAHDERTAVRQAAGSVFRAIAGNRVSEKMNFVKKPDEEEASHRFLELIVAWLRLSSNDTAADCIVEALTLSEANPAPAHQPSTPTVFSHFRRLVHIAASADPVGESGIIVDDAADDAPQPTPGKKKKGSSTNTTTNNNNNNNNNNNPSAADSLAHACLSLLLAIARRAFKLADLKLPSHGDAPASLPKSKRAKVEAAWAAKSDSIASDLSACLPELLADLLPKFRADARGTELLAGIIQCLPPKTWAGETKAAERHTEAVLNALSKAFTTHLQEECLGALAAAWRHLTASDYALVEKAVSRCGEMVGEVVKTAKGKSKQAAGAWLRLAVLVDANVPGAADAAWPGVSEALDKLDVPLPPHAESIVSAAVSCAMVRTHAVVRKNDTAIDLRAEYTSTVAALSSLLGSEKTNDVPQAVREMAFTGLANLLPLGTGLQVIGRPSAQTELDIVGAFDDLVPDFVKPSMRTVYENTIIEADTEKHLMCMVRLLALELLDEKWVATVFLKWPSLHAKGQEIVRALHASMGGTVWNQEAQAIKLANHRYLVVAEGEIDAAEEVLLAVCQKLAAQPKAAKDAAVNVLDVLEDYASISTDNYFVLYAAIPFIRHLTATQCKELLAKIKQRNYNAEQGVAVAHFTTALQKKAGEKLSGRHQEPANETGGDEQKPDAAKAAGQTAAKKARGSRHTSTGTNLASSAKKRVATKLSFEDDDDDEDNEEEPKKPAPAKKRATTAAKQQPTPVSGRKRKGGAAAAGAAAPTLSSLRPAVEEEGEEGEAGESQREYTSPSNLSQKRLRLSKADVSMTFDDEKSDDEAEGEGAAAPTGKKRKSATQGSSAAGDDEDEPSTTRPSIGKKRKSTQDSSAPDDDEEAEQTTTRPSTGKKRKSTQGSSTPGDAKDAEEAPSMFGASSSVAASQESVMVKVPKRRRGGIAASLYALSASKHTATSGDLTGRKSSPSKSLSVRFEDSEDDEDEDDETATSPSNTQRSQSQSLLVKPSRVSSQITEDSDPRLFDSGATQDDDDDEEEEAAPAKRPKRQASGRVSEIRKPVRQNLKK